MNELIKTNKPEVTIRFAKEKDVLLILKLIHGIAEYEKLSHEVVATEEVLRNSLFGKTKYAEVLIADYKNEAVGFALFFHNFSTFLGKPGIYLEDLFVKPEMRGKGIGKILLTYLGKIAIERDCGRLEWSVLDWNEPSIKFYKNLGAKPMDEWTVFRVTGEAIKKLAEQF
ncbi:MAG: GNAT family N-acetyltransferase [Ignavibacteriales bacterium]|nr:GNAT family N-acetyltransferase [Ignavibacteriales bacterium]